MSVIHDTQIYAWITSVILCAVDPIPSNVCLFNYWRNWNIGRLVTVTPGNLWPRPTYVLTRDLTELPAKFHHNLPKIVTTSQYHTDTYTKLYIYIYVYIYIYIAFKHNFFIIIVTYYLDPLRLYCVRYKPSLILTTEYHAQYYSSRQSMCSSPIIGSARICPDKVIFRAIWW